MTLYFRGEKTVDDLRPPFTYRPLIPFFASLLPFKPMTAINLINLMAMVIAMIYMYRILVWLNIDFPLRAVGCGLFVISFPTFYYTTIGYIDPALICLLTVGLYLIFTKNWVFLFGIVVVGAFVKETVIILALILAASLIINRKITTRQGLILPPILLVFLLCYYLARKIIPVDPKVGWAPSLGALISNMSRSRSWLSFLLSFGIPGVLALLIFRYKTPVLLQKRFYEIVILGTGIIISVFLFVYSMLSAHADGRFIWVSYPFSVPMAVIVLEEILRSRKLKNQFGQP